MSVQFQSESEVIDLSASFEFDDVIDDEIGPPIIPSASSSVVPSSENIPMDSNNDSSSGTYSGSDEDSSGESETDDDEEQIATFPFMNSSDSESETNGLTSTVPPPPVELDDTEIITIGDDEDENISLSDMKCDGCPNSQAQFKDRLHKERHIGHSHFVCPTCSKPFIKMSFCMAHEVRQHNRVFDFPIPLVSKALEYVKEKKEQKVYDFVSNIASVVGNYVNPINPNVSAGQDEEIVYEYETDEDDPKFYPEHAVPSTSLYAYRGPELQSLYECYEIQLKFGRKRRMNTNKISRRAVAKRLKLKKEGIIGEADFGRFYKPQSSTRSKKRKKNTKTGKKRSTTAAGNFVPAGKGILIPQRKVLGRGVPINNPNNNDASSFTSTTGACVGAIPPSRSLQRFASLEEFNLRSTVRGQPDISSVPPPPRPDPPRPKSPKPSTSKASKTFIWR